MIVRLQPGDEARLEAFLAGHADSSMFLRSNLRRAGLVYAGEPYQAVWVGLSQGGTITGVAAHGWNGTVLLQAPVRAAELLAAAVRASGRAVSGIIGPAAQVAAARTALGDRPAPALDEREDLFGLDLEQLAVPAPLERGEVRFRPAAAADVALLTAWRRDYRTETLHQAGPGLLAHCAEEVRRLVEGGELFVLEQQGSMVACSAFNARLPDMVQIGGVWTPPSLRGRGFARACVAGSLLEARREGMRRSILFTGAGHHAARRAYLSLGYRVIGDYAIALW